MIDGNDSVAQTGLRHSRLVRDKLFATDPGLKRLMATGDDH